MTRDYGFGTRSIHAGETPDPSTGAHGVPLYQNATYGFDSFEDIEAWNNGAHHFCYARTSNPTVRSLEMKLANLEGAEAAIATASGMAAISATLLHLLAGGGHLVASADLYEETRDFVLQDLPRFGATIDLVDCTSLAAVEAAITPHTRAIYTEAFSNPMLQVVDLEALGEVARRHRIPLVVDNTFLSPALLRPLERGATIVIHSATKYLSGHGNVVGGVICGDRDTIGAIAGLLSRLGGPMSPFNAWLLLAGIKTLPLRMDRHSANALALANLIEGHPAVESVAYPGLPAHPRHAIARRLVGDRFGGMLLISLGVSPSAVGCFLNALSLPTLAVSLGDTATLIWPVAGSSLIRVSVGIEDCADLITDFTTALAAIPLPIAR
jgi:cystathionine beta-lyase/cystathionine gamma-synthase